MMISPRPTPEVVDAVKSHSQADDCIQVRLPSYLGTRSTSHVVVIAAYGMDF